MKKLFTLLFLSFSLLGTPCYLQAQTVSQFSGTTQGFSTNLAAQYNNPQSVVYIGNGSVLVTDGSNRRVRKILPNLSNSVVAGTGVSGIQDGPGASATLRTPSGITKDGFGNIYLTDSESNLIRKINPSGIVSTVAGNQNGGYADGTGGGARFDRPNGVASDVNGNLYIADTFNHRIRKVSTAGVVTTFAGSIQGYVDGTAATARFTFPRGIALDKFGNVYVGEGGRIRKITPTGTVSTLAGSTLGYADGIGTAAQFNDDISSIAIDLQGDLFVADRNNHRIRKVTSTGVVTTYAGTGVVGETNGAANVATFAEPTGVALGDAGMLYIVDRGNHKIRTISAPITTMPQLSFTGFGTIAAFAAQVNFTVTPNNDPTTTVVKYGLVSDELTSEVDGATVTGTGNQPQTVTLSFLTPATVYYAEITVTNSFGSVSSGVFTFTTASSAAAQTIATYTFDNTYTNTSNAAAFSTKVGVGFTTDRHGVANRAINIGDVGTSATISSLPYGNSGRTISLWVKINVLNLYYNFPFAYGAGQRFSGGLDPAKLYLYGASPQLSGTITNIANEWFYLTYTYDGVTAKVYKNGVEVFSSLLTVNTNSNSDKFDLGLNLVNNAQFNGAIDDLEIYNYPLSASAISTKYLANMSTLPVNLISYTAKAQNQTAALNWKTASESNNSHFLVKRSSDGVNFAELAKINGAGTTGANYSYNDTKPLNGVNYYQLIQVDNDGATTDLGVKSVNFSLNASVSIYPNPTADKLYINDVTNSFNTAKIYDAQGKMVLTTNLKSGSSIDVSDLVKGVYFIKLSGNSNETRKFIKL